MLRFVRSKDKFTTGFLVRDVELKRRIIYATSSSKDDLSDDAIKKALAERNRVALSIGEIYEVKGLEALSDVSDLGARRFVTVDIVGAGKVALAVPAHVPDDFASLSEFVREVGLGEVGALGV